jgi:hypothetical protein
MRKPAQKFFVWGLTAHFALLALVGEGLHFLPGWGHSCGHSSHEYSWDGGEKGPPSFGISSLKHSDGVHNAADCAICKYFSLAKPCLFSACLECAPFTQIEFLAVFSSRIESRAVGTYQSRGPPCDFSSIS